jgi:ABC-type lipoprotein export system ATPase subunit
MPDVVMELRNVAKIYDLGSVKVRALDGIDLTVERGDVMVILGPSGSGKSTLLNMLGALDRPTKGRILFEGTSLARLSEGGLSKIRRERIGFVFQSFNLLPILSAVENVMLPLSPARGDKRRLRKRAEALLTSVGLEGRMHHRPSQMSGGEQQRVAIARSLINDPSILLADEPTGNVDSKTSEEIIALLRGVNRERGQTLIIVTHDTRLTAIATRIVRLLDGKVVEDQRRTPKPSGSRILTAQ